MKKILSKTIRPVLRSLGIDIVRYRPPRTSRLRNSLKGDHRDFDELSTSIFKSVEKFTMLSPERIGALISAIEHVVKNKIEGDIVECGTWKGGASMAMALSLLAKGDENRNLFLFDTFAGMSKPTEIDITYKGDIGERIMAQEQYQSGIDGLSYFCYSPINTVRKNLLSTGFPENKIHFIKGRVEETIPEHAPEKIAVIMLDTDWYESTKHEMVHLFPRLSPNGILILDDYGHWEGARKAVDEYFTENNMNSFLHRIDYSGRLIVKSGP